MEGSFILLPVDDKTTVVDNWRCMNMRQWNGKLFCIALTGAHENVALSQQL